MKPIRTTVSSSNAEPVSVLLSRTLKTQAQGMQMNQQVTFVSDGADNVRDLQFYLNPHA